MNDGRVIAVVGPSGVGKDSVMAGLCDAMPGLHRVRRVITRAPGLGGETYDPVTETEFDAMAANGDFALHWRAHGLRYGVPASVHRVLADGTDCLVNLSRGALAQAADIFPRLLVLHVTASPDTLARRLATRGRETADDIRKRRAQADKPLPDGLSVIQLSNDGPLDRTIARAVRLLHPESA